MADTFLKNELCDTEIFDRAIDAGRVTIPELQPEGAKFLNVQKTVQLVGAQLKMAETPQVHVADHPSAAFAVHIPSNSLYITQGLYDTLNNEQLRAVMVLQTCLAHHAADYDRKFSAGKVDGLIKGTAIGAAAGTAPQAYKGIVAALQSTEKDAVLPAPTDRRSFLKQVSTIAGIGFLAGSAMQKQSADQENYQNWVQAAIADYTALTGDRHKTQLLSALMQMNDVLAKDNKEKSVECQKAIATFMQYAITTEPSTQLRELPPTDKTRVFSQAEAGGVFLGMGRS